MDVLTHSTQDHSSQHLCPESKAIRLNRGITSVRIKPGGKFFFAN